MAADNGDLEIQEDSLDTAIKRHRRATTPGGLLDRCLSTVVPANRAVETTLAVLTESRIPIQQRVLSRPWLRWALAASIVCLLGGGYFMYVSRVGMNEESFSMRFASRMPSSGSSAEEVEPTSQHEGGYLFQPGDQRAANGPASASTRVKYLRDGTANTVELGESDSIERLDRGSADTAAGYRPSNMSLGKEVASHDDFEFKPQSVRTGKEQPALDSIPAGNKSGSTSEASPPSSGKTPDSKIWTELTKSRLEAQAPAAPGKPADSESKEHLISRGTLVSGRALPKNLEQSVAGFKAKAVGEPLREQVDATRKPVLGLKYNDHYDDLAERVQGPNTESYARVSDNAFLAVSKSPLSTFSTDVDTASYANVRRFLNQGQMPPRDAVRIEELINYFSYDYAQPKAGDPFSVNLEVAGCPWNGEHRLVRIGLKGREIADQQRPPANLVFLVDVSGSMQPTNKLPLLKTAMKMLVGRLGENERVAIVTYSHEIRLVLPSTTCDSKETIIQALDGLQAAGSTNGGGGIQMAYSVAVENFIQGGVNRVLLATDGDFNVGITDREELTRFIEQKRESGVFLSVLGFGMGNLKDATLERLADKGNGHFAYIDSIDEARKVLVDQLSGTLVTIAKDVKLQIEFNPRTVSAYRLIGYENRVMPAQDFNDDRKDAGDIGAGHTVTALYEIVPAGKSAGLPGTDPLKYQPEERPADEDRRRPDDVLVREDVRRELLTVKLRYKKPNEHQSLLAEVPLSDSGRRYGEASSDFRFASAVAAFGMILRDSPHRGSATLDGVLELGEEGRGADREGYRSEFLKLVRLAKSHRGQ